MKKHLLLITTTILVSISSWAQDKEAYAVVSLDGKTVQLFYDTNKIENLGISIHSFDYQSATRIIIDESMSEYHPEIISDWFCLAKNLESIQGLKYLNTNNVTSMANLFNGCSKLTELDLSNFDTSNATSMYQMFYNCSSLADLDIRHFNTTKVKNMFGMFYDCSSLTNLDLSGWDTNQVTTMEYMFNGCTSLKSLDLSGWGNANVTDMHYMFQSCTSLTDLNLNNFGTPNLLRSWYMFAFCSSLVSLDLSSFDTTNMTSMWRMFLNCTSIKTLNLSSFNTENVTTLEGTFFGCSSLETIDLSSFNVKNVLSMKETFCGCTSLKTIYASDLWKLRPPKSGADAMFKDCFNLVGEQGTTYNSNRTSHVYARFDNPPSAPGYLTKKETCIIEQQEDTLTHEPVKAEYFIDSDPGYGKGIPLQKISTDTLHFVLSIEGLKAGAHMLYVRSSDDGGKWSSTVARPLYVSPVRQEQFVQMEYFFDDNDPGFGKATPLSDFTAGMETLVTTLSTDGLKVGAHLLNVRGRHADGLWASVTSRSFLVIATEPLEPFVEYFFDNDPGYGKGIVIKDIEKGTNRLVIDLGDLPTGAHVLYVRSRDEEGLWSVTVCRPFYVCRSANLAALEYFFDNNDPGQGNATSIALPTTGSDVITFEVDLTGLSTGEHTLNVRAKDSDGLWRPLTSEGFTLMTNSGISATEVERTLTATFTLSGYRTNTPQRGVNIVRFNDGKTKKLIINNKTKN